MGVIALPLISPQGPIGPVFEWGLRSNTGVSRAQSGATRTVERRGGPQFATLRYRNLHDSEAARLRSFLMQCRGMANRFYVPDFSYTQRGSFAASELLTNNTFANGTTGWTPGGNTSLTAADGVLRLTRTKGETSAAFYAGQSSLSVSQYAPYAMRVLTSFASPGETNYGASFSSGVALVTAFGTTPALHTAAGIVLGTTASVFADQSGQSGVGAGSYRNVAYTSYARCALVDNAPNSLVRSDELDNASWTKSNATITPGSTDPLATTGADAIVENTANNSHHVTQSASRASASVDLCAYGHFKRGAGTRDVEIHVGSDASNYGRAIFDLGAGTITAVTNVGGGTDHRAFIAARGDGWYFCTIIFRSPASPTLYTRFALSNAGSDSYTGDGTSSVLAWRLGGALSGMPTRGVQTVASALASGTSQTGAALYLRGLPVSTSGLLLKDDLVEIVTPNATELKRVVAALNSDAAGLGHLQFEPPLRESPADSAAVIVRTPMMRCLLDDNSVDWSAAQGVFTDMEFRVVEDVVPT